MASLLKKKGARLHTPERLTDVERAKELCKELVLSQWHTSGSCAMTPREDGGVVDAKLKVYGTANVRVMDASVFPLEPRGISRPRCLRWRRRRRISSSRSFSMLW